MRKSSASQSQSASELIPQRIAELGDWRRESSAGCASSSREQTRASSRSGNGWERRAIDIHEGELVDESAFKALILQAVAMNGSGKSTPAKKAKP
jgi:hypothetical protein